MHEYAWKVEAIMYADSALCWGSKIIIFIQLFQEFVEFKQTMECTVKLTELSPSSELMAKSNEDSSQITFSKKIQALEPIQGECCFTMAFF